MEFIQNNISVIGLLIIVGIIVFLIGQVISHNRKAMAEWMEREDEVPEDEVRTSSGMDGSWANYLSEPETQDSLRKSIVFATDLCAGLAKDAGWDSKPRETGTELMLIVSELAEAMEGDRKNLMDDHLPNRKMIEVELADAAIRIFHLSGRLKLDVAGAMVDKLLYNTQRADHKLENRNQDPNGKKY